jgi:hypothetical protein
MSTVKLSGLPELTTADNNDVLLITDTDAVTSKKITKANLLSGYLTSFTETDPVVGAVTGIVKADGAGNISAAVAGTDYATAAQGSLADSALQNLVEDTTPQLGGTLDANGNSIDMGTYTITDAGVGQWDSTSLTVGTKESNWDAAYGWGNHASAGYLDSGDIGSTVQAYDADTAKYDDTTANFTGTLQHGGHTVLTNASDYLDSADIGVSVQAYDADTAKYDDTTANFTGTLQNGGSNVVVDSDIGSTVVGSTFTGDVDITGELVVDSYNESYAAVTSSSGSLTIDCESGNNFSLSLSENVTSSSFSNPPTTGTAYGFVLKVIQDSTDRTITWPTSVDWPAATAPTLSSGSGAVDVFVFYTHDGGTTWFGFTAGQGLG